MKTPYQIELEKRFPKANLMTLYVHACGEVDSLRATPDKGGETATTQGEITPVEIPESFKQGMEEIARGETMSLDDALAAPLPQQASPPSAGLTDTQRLDWLEQETSPIYGQTVHSLNWKHGQSLRSVIDAAIQQSHAQRGGKL